MEHSHLRLEGYYFREFAFSVRDDMDDKVPVSLPTVLHVHPRERLTGYRLSSSTEYAFESNQENANRFRVVMTIATKEDEKNFFPYSFKLAMVGYFRLAEGMSDDLIKILVSSAAPSTLYSLAREFIAATTGRGPFPGAVLPLVAIEPRDFDVSLLKGAAAATKAAPAAQPRKKKSTKKSKKRRSARSPKK